MSWVCPACSTEVPLWQRKCPNCTGAPTEEGEQPEPAAGSHKASSPHTAATRTESLAGTKGVEGTAPLRSASLGKAPVPWVAYLVMALVLAAVAIALWPSDRTHLRLQSEPAGAVVLLDGKRAGETPLELAGLKHGLAYAFGRMGSSNRKFWFIITRQPQEG